jgi:hypothetical protein
MDRTPLILRLNNLQLVHWKLYQKEKLSLAKMCKGFSERFGHGKAFTRSDLRQSGGNLKRFWLKFPPGGFSVWWKSERRSVTISTYRIFGLVEMRKKFCSHFLRMNFLELDCRKPPEM